MICPICKVQIWKHKLGNDKARRINRPQPTGEALCVCPEVVNYIHISLSGHFNVSFSWKRNHGIHMNTHQHTQTERKEHISHSLFFSVSLPSVAVWEVEACWNATVRILICQCPPPPSPYKPITGWAPPLSLPLCPPRTSLCQSRPSLPCPNKQNPPAVREGQRDG